VKFTANQSRAILYAGQNLQLIARAGSGKTEAVSRRVVHLLTPGRPDTLLPRNIIAVTFTDKAAAELKERIHTRTRQALGDIPGMAPGMSGSTSSGRGPNLKGDVKGRVESG
jgi:DNA helicase-2/ATP-dependent DNA helicase PcrA